MQMMGMTATEKKVVQDTKLTINCFDVILVINKRNAMTGDFRSQKRFGALVGRSGGDIFIL